MPTKIKVQFKGPLSNNRGQNTELENGIRILRFCINGKGQNQQSSHRGTITSFEKKISEWGTW